MKKDAYELWTADDMQEIITVANSSKNKQKTFDKLGLKFNRSSYAIQKVYYKNRKKKTLNIPKEERDEAIRRLSARGVTQREIALRHEISQTSVHHILYGWPKRTPKAEQVKTVKEITPKSPVVKPVVVKQAAPKPVATPKPTSTPVVYTYELNILWGAFKITNKTINK